MAYSSFAIPFLSRLDGVSPVLVSQRGLHGNAQGPVGLDKIVKLSLMRDLPKEEIERVWLEHHKSIPGSLSAVVPSSSWDKLKPRLSRCKMFLFPLLRASGGFDNLVMQFQANDNTCLFTSLEQYKLSPSTAPVLLSTTYYEDLLQEKGIVLMGGHAATSVSDIQATAVTNSFQAFYLADEKFALVEKFNHKPSEFSFDDWMRENMLTQ
jgi:ATP synthase F1 complex assembly factor 1